MKQRFGGLRSGGLGTTLARFKTKLQGKLKDLVKGFTRHFANAMLAVRSFPVEKKEKLSNEVVVKSASTLSGESRTEYVLPPNTESENILSDIERAEIVIRNEMKSLKTKYPSLFFNIRVKDLICPVEDKYVISVGGFFDDTVMRKICLTKKSRV